MSIMDDRKAFFVNALGYDGPLPQLEYDWLVAQGATGSTLADLWKSYLGSAYVSDAKWGQPYPLGVEEANLLVELDWTAGASTTVSIANGRARGTATTTTNPRIYKGPIAVTAGVTYRLKGTVYTGTLSGGGQSTDNLFVRMATTTGIADGTVAQTSQPSLVINQTFVPVSSGNLYFGVVGVVTTGGEYFEINDGFSITQE